MRMNQLSVGQSSQIHRKKKLIQFSQTHLLVKLIRAVRQLSHPESIQTKPQMNPRCHNVRRPTDV